MNEQQRAIAAARYPAIAAGHKHPEAFNLMHYGCERCGHHEIIWNSRDGVTAFGTRCPSCNAPNLLHVRFDLDRYDPDHVPFQGQRVWASMSKVQAAKIARDRLAAQIAMGRNIVMSDEDILKLAISIWDKGLAPYLMVHGYTESP